MTKKQALFEYVVTPDMDWVHLKDQKSNIIAGFDSIGAPFGNAAAALPGLPGLLGPGEAALDPPLFDGYFGTGFKNALWITQKETLDAAYDNIALAIELQDGGTGDGYCAAVSINASSLANSLASIVGIGVAINSEPGDGKIVDRQVGIDQYTTAQGSGTVTELYGADFHMGKGGTTVITTAALIRLRDMHGISTTANYALLIDNQGTGANDYAIFSAGGKVHLSLPTADPRVAGVLWADSTDSFRVKASQG